MLIVLFIVGGLAALFVAVNLMGLLLPRTWAVERACTIGADQSAVQPLIASFRHGWSRWNPWGSAADPTIQMTYSGPDTGVGATQSWTGGETGGGTMTIVEATADRIAYNLAFGPFTISGRLDLAVTGGGTALRWTVSGRIAGLPAYRFGRYFAQRIVGRALERGLATLDVEARRDGAARDVPA